MVYTSKTILLKFSLQASMDCPGPVVQGTRNPSPLKWQVHWFSCRPQWGQWGSTRAKTRGQVVSCHSRREKGLISGKSKGKSCRHSWNLECLRSHGVSTFITFYGFFQNIFFCPQGRFASWGKRDRRRKNVLALHFYVCGPMKRDSMSHVTVLLWSHAEPEDPGPC